MTLARNATLLVTAMAALMSPVAGRAQADAPPPPTETALTARGPTGTLAGTLIAPARNRPTILILPGSGPTDRDGNSPAGVATASYRQLAHALAQRGIGSVRIDKRGMFGSTGAGDPNAVTIAAYAADVRGWITAARERTGAPCIWIAGHSEGGLVALFAAAENPDSICGVITIAAPGRRLGDVMRVQLGAALAGSPFLEPANAAITELEAGRAVAPDTLPPPLRGLFNSAVQPFLIDLLSHDPAALAARLTMPLLVMQGDGDLQTSIDDARLLAGDRPGATLAILTGVNHLLVPGTLADRAANLASYRDPAQRIDQPAVETIATYITAAR